MKLEDNSRRTIIYKNGIKKKFKNKSISIVDDNDVFEIQISNININEAHVPAVHHIVDKKILRTSLISLSRETMEALVICYFQLTDDEITLKRKQL